MGRHRFALLLLPCVVTMLGCELVTGLSDLEKDPDFDPDAEVSVPAETSTTDTANTGDTGAVVTDTSSPSDTSTEPADADGCGKPGSKTYGGHCYFPLTTNLSFTDAKDKCAMEGGYLAIITSSGENDLVAQIDNAAERWIGLSRAAADPNVVESYKWVDNSAFDATKFNGWATDEPNGGDAARLKGADGKWYDREGATTTTAGIHAICEME